MYCSRYYIVVLTYDKFFNNYILHIFSKLRIFLNETWCTKSFFEYDDTFFFTFLISNNNSILLFRPKIEGKIFHLLHSVSISILFWFFILFFFFYLYLGCKLYLHKSIEELIICCLICKLLNCYVCTNHHIILISHYSVGWWHSSSIVYYSYFYITFIIFTQIYISTRVK